ncbi:hypothetical protein SISNIDRAFT_526718 [Sistotremastrum niveocremeum HHB9708]|uniref:Uncharacterized protein n=1 Tax=Sistotremastrum niveocremeum HHB9708 TaxID=1314777 RepID=A0A164QA63_9AGAM|nr:hypothetical protein SISNIDRAFT_526718 [Sistotremastrum niveocremeum HHB9708]
MSESSGQATLNEYERLGSGDLTLLNHTPVKASLTEDGPWIHLEEKSQVAGYPSLQGSMSSYGFDENVVPGEYVGFSRRLRCFWRCTKWLFMHSFLPQWETFRNFLIWRRKDKDAKERLACYDRGARELDVREMYDLDPYLGLHLGDCNLLENILMIQICRAPNTSRLRVDFYTEGAPTSSEKPRSSWRIHINTAHDSRLESVPAWNPDTIVPPRSKSKYKTHNVLCNLKDSNAQDWARRSRPTAPMRLGELLSSWFPRHDDEPEYLRRSSRSMNT